MKYKTETVVFDAGDAAEARREIEKAKYLLALVGQEDPANKLGLGDCIAELEAFASHRGPRPATEKFISFEVTLFRKDKKE